MFKQLIEINTTDCTTAAAEPIMMAELIRMKQEGYQPNRDIIVALTADEEGGAFNGVDWLVKNPAFVLNHNGGRVVVENGKVLRLIVAAAESVHAEYRLSSLDSAGPGSSPDNATHHLTDALARLEHYTFPFEMNPVTRAELAEMAGSYPPEEAALIRAALKEPPDQEAIAKLSAGCGRHVPRPYAWAHLSSTPRTFTELILSC